MGIDRHEEFVGDYHLIAAFMDGAYQGRAWAKRNDLENLSAIGTSISDVCMRLKQLIKEENLRVLPHRQELAAEHRRISEDRSNALRLTLSQRHKDRLATLGCGIYQGLQPQSHAPRASHCYNCKASVDNSVDQECVTCGWIVCNECAACGCGYV